jgi:hypothetical protein
MKPVAAFGKFFFVLLIYAALSSPFTGAFAQKSYLTAGIGYGFALAPFTEGTGMPYTYNSGEATLGEGMTYGFNIGHMVNGKTGIDLGIWYVAGSTYINDTGDSNLVFVPSRFSGNTLRIMPAFRTSWGMKNKFYVKLGVVLGIATDAEIEAEYNINNTCGTSPYIVTHKFSGGTSSGWFGTFGINFYGEEKTSFFVEANFVKQYYEPVLETVDACGAATTTFDLVDNPDPMNPNEKPKPEFPFSSIGINAGVKILLGVKKTEAPPSGTSQ